MSSDWAKQVMDDVKDFNRRLAAIHAAERQKQAAAIASRIDSEVAMSVYGYTSRSGYVPLRGIDSSQGRAANLSGIPSIVPQWLRDIEQATERLNPRGENVYRDLRLRIETLAANSGRTRASHHALLKLYADSQALLNQPKGTHEVSSLLAFIGTFAAWARSL